jgi:hypothetical protein
MGKTFLSLFSSFDKDELCQLYVYPTIPDTDACHSWYRITDRDVLRSYTRFGKVNGRVIRSDEIDTRKHEMFESEDDRAFLKKKKKNSFSLICRDILWSFARWNNRSLHDWLADEKPDCIFVAPGQSKFIYNIALKIARILKVNVFTYVCDDYYLARKHLHPMDWLHSFLLRKTIRKLMVHSKMIITICDELSEAYHHEFGTQTRTICTGSNYPIAEMPKTHPEINGLPYMGNIRCNRFRSLADIGRCLDVLNAANGTNYGLFLYTSPLDEEQQQAFAGIRSIRYQGYVTGPDFDRTFHDAAILLHVEAFDEASKNRVKYSVSTKIADSLCSGNLLVAYGPEDVASVRHLIRHRCAKVVTNPEALQDALQEALSGVAREETIRSALVAAAAYHTSKTNSRELKSLLQKCGE